MRGFEESGPRLEGEVRVRRMIISASPTSPGLRLLHRFLSQILFRFLDSMLDYLDEEVASSEEGQVMDISAGTPSMFTSSSEIGIMDIEEYSSGKESK